jgi:hypothetical protein
MTDFVPHDKGGLPRYKTQSHMRGCVCENKLAVVWQPHAQRGDGRLGFVYGQRWAPNVYRHPQVLRT